MIMPNRDYYICTRIYIIATEEYDTYSYIEEYGTIIYVLSSILLQQKNMQ